MSPLAGLRARAPVALRQRMNYSTYKSPFGPKYKTQPHIAGFTAKDAVNYGILAGGFGGVAGIFALFFFAEVPRVREDIIKKVPFLGSFFDNEVAPEDNPF